MAHTPDPTTVLAATGLAVLDISGPDAVAFLHGQLSHDVAELPDGASRLAAYCTPKGRILGLLRIWRNSAGVSALVDASVADAVAKRLAMFVLRAKARVSVRPDLRVAGLIGPDLAAALTRAGLPAPAAPGRVCAHGAATVLALPGAHPRVALVLPEDALDPTLAALACPSGDAAQWLWADIAAGLGQVTATTRELFLPHHLNLDLTDGLSFRKGCYPGQEIVARMHYRGRPTRRMLRLAADTTDCPAPGSTLHDAAGAQPCGEVVCAAPVGGGVELLAVVQVGAVRRPLYLGSANGPALRVLELPYAIPELA